jgi:hypothetical protein
VGCKANSIDSASKEVTIIKILPDTSYNWQAKDEFNSYKWRKGFAEKLGLDDIEKSNDTLEIRVWWEASIYSPSSVWAVHNRRDSSIAVRIDYYTHYDSTVNIDSMFVIKQIPIVNSWTEYFKAIDLSKFWSIPFHYHLNGRYGCVDGERLTIEMFNGHKYKTVTYPCYMMYRESAIYKDFTSLVTNITALK